MLKVGFMIWFLNGKNSKGTILKKKVFYKNFFHVIISGMVRVEVGMGVGMGGGCLIVSWTGTDRRRRRLTPAVLSFAGPVSPCADLWTPENTEQE